MSDEHPVVEKKEHCCGLRMHTVHYSLRSECHGKRSCSPNRSKFFKKLDDMSIFVKRRRILHCVLIISARHFVHILIKRFMVVTSGAIVRSLISHGCWKENIRQVNQHMNQLQHLGRQPRVPRKKKVNCYFHRNITFFVEKAARSRGHPSRVWRSCWQSMLRKQLQNEQAKSVTPLC